MMKPVVFMDMLCLDTIRTRTSPITVRGLPPAPVRILSVCTTFAFNLLDVFSVITVTSAPVSNINAVVCPLTLKLTLKGEG